MKSISIYRINAVLLMIILLAVILYFGKAFLIPLFLGILLVMLLVPVCDKLEKWGMSRIWSSISGVLIIVLFVAAILGIIAAQGVSLSQDMPRMQEKAQQLYQQVQDWIQSQYGISPQEQQSYLQKGMKKASSSSSGSFGKSFFSSLMSMLTGFVLVLLYSFFLLWKRDKYREFFLKLVNEENREETGRELDQIRQVASKYLIGRLISMVFLAVFYIIGFSIVGLPNGPLVALVAVIPTIIPYVGSIVGGIFPVAMALVGDSSGVLLPVVIILVVAQIIDNNIIEPLVEGESLDISPFFTIVAIVLGELVWGVAGMILFIPMFAILKIVCDHLPVLHPYSFLLDNDLNEPGWVLKIKEWFKKK
ncbi:AI-2E family transporter [Pedobacter sp. SYSU D00535]|uniref:AI-2E family transporter n=1 Tax=Pedobacter sp. SYSU D00535 TaxID=2810308 RepID=UPI001A97CD43|nr:AI-2E family transporter [Pedobacter sp. SYSU D00535]